MLNTFSLRQQRMSLKLARIDQKAADAYLGALNVLKNPDNPDRHSQAAHSLREITTIFSRKVNIPQELEKTEENLKTKIEKKFVEKSGSLPLPAEEETKFLLKKWMEIHQYFLKISHHGEPAIEEEFETKLAEFETILSKFIESIPVTLDQLDKLLNIQSPQEDHVKTLSELIKHPSHVQYFFSKLTSPDWLQPLSSQGFFSKIPETIKEGNYIKFPNWPLSKYLIKISGVKPEEVIDIIKKIPKTDNVGVHLDLINCGLQMPSTYAKEMVPLAKRWIVNPYRTLIPDKIGELIVKLTKDNEMTPALDLLDTLLDVKLQDKKEVIFSREAEPLFNSWAYNQILINVVPLVFAKEPNRVLEILCEKLSKAITIEQMSEGSVQFDFSRYWRPAIEESSQNFERGVKNELLSAIRNNLEQLVTVNDKSFRSCYGALSKYKFSIFRRIELHLMNKFPNLLQTEIQQLLSNKEIFENSDLYHEKFHLLQNQYQKLPKQIKEKILERIANGPDLGKFESNYKDRNGKPPTEEEKKDYKSRWQMISLYPIRDYIPSIWKEKLKKFLTQYGEMEHPDYLAYHGPVVVGSTSPISEEDFKKKSLKEILEFLRTWKQSKKFSSPTREALGGIMGKVISDNPKKYVPLSKDIGESSPVYIYHFLQGYREALKKGNDFEWDQIITLCKVVVTSDHKYGSSEDSLYDLKAVKGAVCDILEEGLRNNVPIPIEFRSAILELIRTLLKDNEPDQNYENKYAGANMDPFNLSLNTVRGKAMHALVLYALWCAKHIYSPKAADKMVPEVKELLEMHLNPDFESTQTVRAVYGCYLPNLFYLNSEWTEKQLPKIFPKGAEFRTLSRAAWEAYVKYATFYGDVYSKMGNEYRNAINKLNSPKISKNAKSKLAEHLTLAYLWGLEELGNDSLTSKFFNMKQFQVNGHAIWLIGKFLGNIQKEETDIKIKERIMERSLELWKWRIDEARKMDETTRKRIVKELKLFGFWFINSPFDEKSAISQLCMTVEITEGIMDFATEIIKKLPDYASDYSSEVLRILDLLVRGDNNKLLPILSKEKIREILEIVTMKRPPQEIRVPVNRLVDSLTRMGYHEFRDFFIEEQI